MRLPLPVFVAKSENKSQSGFTLIELIIGLAITSIIMGILVAAIYQVLFRESEIKNRAKVMLALQDASFWISRDVMNAQCVDASDPQHLKLDYTVQWPKAGSYQYVYTYEVTYDYSGNVVNRNELLNTKKYNAGTGVLVQTTNTARQTFVAGNVDAFSTEWQDGAVRLTLTASAGKYSETRNYAFTPRIN